MKRGYRFFAFLLAMALCCVASAGVCESSATQSARLYLNFMAFSRQGLIEQLEYEGFSHEDAVTAVDACDADWSEQAVKKAQSYLSFTSFSEKGMIEQLEYDGFTHEEAVAAVDACDVDWNEQAVKKAQS